MGTAQVLLVIGAIIIAGMLTVQMSSSLSNLTDIDLYNQALITATGIAQSSLDEAVGKAFDEKTISTTVTSADSLTSPVALGPETGETSASKYDDVDDYDGYLFTDSVDVFGTFRVMMTVSYIQDMSPGVSSSVRTFSKEITAKLTNRYLADTLEISVVKSY